MSGNGCCGRTVVHVTWEYPPRIVGGLGRYVGALARAQARQGDRVIVVAPGYGRASNRVALGEAGWGSVTVVRAGRRPAPGEGPFLWQLARLEARLAWAALGLPTRRPGWAQYRQSAFFGPVVVHAHDWLVAEAATRLADTWRAPLAVTFHATQRGRLGAGVGRDVVTRAADLRERALAVRADVSFAVSGSVAREVVALGATTVRWAPGGFDAGAPVPTRHPSPYRVLVACRLVPEKGVHVLLRAVARLAAEGMPVSLAVAGEGPEAASLKDLAERLRIEDRVSWLGYLSAGALARHLARAAVVAAPSLYEPFGLSALEAVTAGAPLVASRVDGLAEWAEPVARLVPPGDPIALAEALAAAMTDPHPPTARDVRVRLGHLTWEGLAARVSEGYATVLPPRLGGAGLPEVVAPRPVAALYGR